MITKNNRVWSKIQVTRQNIFLEMLKCIQDYITLKKIFPLRKNGCSSGILTRYSRKSEDASKTSCNIRSLYKDVYKSMFVHEENFTKQMQIYSDR